MLLLSVAYQMMEVNKSLHVIDYINLRKQNEEIPLGFRSGLIHNSCIPAVHLICNATVAVDMVIHALDSFVQKISTHCNRCYYLFLEFHS